MSSYSSFSMNLYDGGWVADNIAWNFNGCSVSQRAFFSYSPGPNLHGRPLIDQDKKKPKYQI